jgi:hypothetical protein
MAVAQAAGRPVAWGPLLVAMIVGAAAAGVVAWRVNLQSIDRQIKAKRSSLKKLSLSGGIPPNDEVMTYLTARQASVQRGYDYWLRAVAADGLTDAARADPQLYFQEKFHEVQRTLEKLAAARTMPAPEQLGFPKDLPPSDTVPRLLVQLSLIQEAATLMLEQEIESLASLRVEDPETVYAEDGETPFLMRLPVRVRLTCSLSGLMKILALFERAEPVIDVRALRVASGGDGAETLTAELQLARYLVMAPTEQPAPEDEERAPKKKRSKRARTAPPAAD